jgi:purine-nucleoside phosphorylase
VSTHIGAAAGEIAPVVLLPGDPLRAKWIAETFLDDAQCYTQVRGMLGFTGTWHGRRVSIQASGMGQPSAAIYLNELFREYDVQSVVRVGSCGALTERLALRDIVIGSGACTDSSMNRIAFEGLDYAPVADFDLLRGAVEAAEQRVSTSSTTDESSTTDASSTTDERSTTDASSTTHQHGIHVGLLFSSDSFYAARPELVSRMVGYGVLAVEMEASALYTLAAKFGRRALAVCTVSDHIVTGERTTTDEREQTFGEMVEIALAAAVGRS